MNDLGAPGHAAVRVVHAGDPATEAARLAEELGGDVASDGATAERLVRTRVDAGRRGIGGDADEDAAVLARADEIRAAVAVDPPIGDADVEELRHLADDLGRASRIRERTEARVSEVLQAKVAASTGVALHPAAVASAAEGVIDAERAFERAETTLLEHGAPPSAPEPVETQDDPVLNRPHDDFDEAALERRRAGGRALAFALVMLGGAGAAVALGAPIAVLAGAAVVSLLFALLLLRRGHRAAARVTGEADHNLAAVAAAVAATDSGRLAASLAARETWVEERAELEAARDEAEELLRVARNRWNQLAGPGTDPHDAEDVIRAHDPQLVYDERVSASSPTVRTVAAFHRRVHARWRVLWAGLGRDEPPGPEALEALLDHVLGDHRRAMADLRRLEEAEIRSAAAEAVRRPLVLVEPRGWVAPGRLAQLLSSVPPEGEVVLVERGAN
jgi:hypothetical protein